MASSAGAQTHLASVRGTITDVNHAVIPGAVVNISNSDTLESRSVTSDARGEYAISSLPPGRYVLSMQATGFERDPQRLVLQVNQLLRIDVVMEWHVPARYL